MNAENRETALSPKKAHLVPNQSRLENDEKPCPFCAETVKAAAVKCRFCGEYFGTPTGSLGASQPSQVVVNNVINNTAMTAPLPYLKSRGTAALLAFFLGGLGVHKFYVGRSGSGLLYFLFCWTFIPAIVGFLEALSYLSFRDDEDFTRRACF